MDNNSETGNWNIESKKINLDLVLCLNIYLGIIWNINFLAVHLRIPFKYIFSSFKMCQTEEAPTSNPPLPPPGDTSMVHELLSDGIWFPKE